MAALICVSSAPSDWISTVKVKVTKLRFCAMQQPSHGLEKVLSMCSSRAL